MKQFKQKYKHDPKNGSFGDCYRTCLACLINSENLDDVPNFAELMFLPDGTDNPDRIDIQETKKYLASQGYFTVSHAFEGSINNVLEMQRVLHPEVYYILTGRSDRGINHSVICLGGEFFHDPHESNSFLINPTTDGYFWIEYLIPIQMTEYKNA